MKKILFSLLVMCMTFANANAQKFTGNVGVMAGADFPSLATVVTANVTAGIGWKWENGFYLGAGIAPGAMNSIMKDGGADNTTSYNMPFYAQASYINGKHWYADVKLGGEYFNIAGNSSTIFFLNLTPLGYSFNDHSSLGLGFRMDGTDMFGFNVSYSYCF